MGKSELRKAPMVADAYKDVIRQHTFDPVEHNPEDSHDDEGVRYVGSTDFGGHRIHTFHENHMDGESFIHHVITDNGEHTGKTLSRVSIEQQIPDDYEGYGDETHHLTHAATHPDHRGKGMSYALHKYAIKDLRGKTLHSDTRLSPESHAVWKKLRRDPDLKVKLSRQLSNIDTAHTAQWMGKSESTLADFKKSLDNLWYNTRSKELSKGSLGPECKAKLKAYSSRKGWRWPNAVTALQAKRICGSKKK
jgi:hypothetical protein